MLTGWFENGTGRPYITGRVLLPRLGSVSTDILWVVDTGADSSHLSAQDAEALRLDYSQLMQQSAMGIAGATASYIEPAMLLFFDPGVGLHTYWLDLPIAGRRDRTADLEQVESVPSVLGRDVLDYWLMVYSRMDSLLQFDVRYADATNPTANP